jgi:cytoskeleton protein RodZ
MADTALRSENTPAPATRLGAELKAARHQLGWELPQLASSLRIRQSYLEAIETGRIADLPGTTYALGFVRAYAAALGLPGEEMARRFRAEADGVTGKPTLHFPAPVPRRGVPAGAVMLLGLVILVGAYGGWYWWTEHRATPVETVPPIPDRLAEAAQMKSPPSPQVASILPSTAPPAPAPQSAQVSAQAAARSPLPPQDRQPVPTAAPPSTQAPPAPVPAPQAPVTAAAAPAPAAQKPVTPQPAAAPAGGRIVVATTGDAWLTVKQPNGPPVLNKMMHAGDTWAVPADATGLTLNTGNAGATILQVDGVPIPQSLGASGMVRRNIPLDVDVLKSGKIPPPAPRGKPKAPAAAPG